MLNTKEPLILPKAQKISFTGLCRGCLGPPILSPPILLWTLAKKQLRDPISGLGILALSSSLVKHATTHPNTPRTPTPTHTQAPVLLGYTHCRRKMAVSQGQHPCKCRKRGSAANMCVSGRQM